MVASALPPPTPKGTMYRRVRAMVSEALSRARLSHRLGSTHNGARDIEEVLGYKDRLDYADFKQAYKRYGIAHRLVNAYPEETWNRPPRVREPRPRGVLADSDPTPFEQDWLDLVKRLDLYNVFQNADIQGNLGHYSVVVLGLSNQPLQSKASRVSGQEDLLWVRAYSEQYCEIETFGKDPTDISFGRPSVYRLDTESSGRDDRLRRPLNSRGVLVDASRAVHIPGEYRLDDEIYGLPILEAVYNTLVDLLKVVGGSAEMFWRDAKRRIALEVRQGAQIAEEDAEAISDEVEEFMHGLRDFLRLEGMEAKNLAGLVASPKEHFDVLIQILGGTRSIPQRILLGSERGELSSTQDEDFWLRKVARRQVKYAEPIFLRQFINRCIEYHVLSPPAKGYEIEWDNLNILTETQQATVAKDKASALSVYAAGNAVLIVPPAEFREQIMGLPAESTYPMPEGLLAAAVGGPEDTTPPPDPGAADTPPAPGRPALPQAA